MPYLLLILGVFIAIYALYRFFLNANTKEIKALFLSISALMLGISILFLAITGRLVAALALVIAFAPFAAKLREEFKNPKAESPPPSSSEDMSRKEALEVLGLKENPRPDEIRTAYKKLMQKVHPDAEGSDWMAAKLNQARDVLLKSR